MSQLFVEVLGPLRLTVDGRPVVLPGPVRRALLALLVMAEGRAQSVDALSDALWGDQPPGNALGSLHSHVSRLRRALGAAAGRLAHTPAGYRLALSAEEWDLGRARRLAGEARELALTDSAVAAGLLEEALRTWRGEALAEFGEVRPLAMDAVAVAEFRSTLQDEALAAGLAVGQHARLVEAAARSAAAEPLRERAHLLWMEALAGSGRAAEALRAGHDYRLRLRDEAGLDPSPALADLERRIAGGALGTGPAPEPPRRALENMPRLATPLLGRADELAHLRDLLRSGPLVTVVGPGGAGKTRLALEVAREAEGAVTVVLLAAVRDPAVVPDALAGALHVRAGPGTTTMEACLDYLSSVPRLLLLDNCEHLADAACDLIDAVLTASLRVTVLVTSREPLGLPAERLLRLAPLPLPDLGSPAATSPAIALFVDRARRVRPGFALNPAQVPVVREICRALDGLPLAIELAAAQLGSLSLNDVRDRLARRLDLLRGPRPTADARHRTLRSTIDWSDALLTTEEQRLFRHLSLFAGGFSLPAAEQVGSVLRLPLDPAGVLARLVESSMVVADLEGEDARYGMLETVRVYGQDRLADSGQLAQAVDGLLAWATGFVRDVDRGVYTADEPSWDRRARLEVANLRLARRSALDRSDLAAAAAISVGLDEFGLWRDVAELWAWSLELADDPRLPGTALHAPVISTAAGAAWLRGELERAERLGRLGLDLATSPTDRRRSLDALAAVSLFRGDSGGAQRLWSESARLAPDRPDSTAGAALASAYAGDHQQAVQLAAQSLKMAEDLGAPTLQAFAHYVQGEIAADQHELALAVDLARQSGATFVEGIALVGLAPLWARSGALDQAADGYAALIHHWQRTGTWVQQWTTLRNAAELLADLGRLPDAVLLLLAADRAPEAPALSGATADRLSLLMERLPRERLSALQAEAGTLPRTEIVQRALAALCEPGAEP